MFLTWKGTPAISMPGNFENMAIRDMKSRELETMNEMKYTYLFSVLIQPIRDFTLIA
ncbi:unnamed protein product [Paramecium octaurelia]|uniref:Uncharacterized protein n=1 Tax=Paramecium octaurelia TaxID=43137 RepID=A0A8S1YIK2_PAROT|nr:unnamed protein product [Paramecium octaurelia]